MTDPKQEAAMAGGLFPASLQSPNPGAEVLRVLCLW